MKFRILAKQLSDLCIQLSTCIYAIPYTASNVTQHVLDHFHCLVMDRKSGSHSQCPKLCLIFYILSPSMNSSFITYLESTLLIGLRSYIFEMMLLDLNEIVYP